MTRDEMRESLDLVSIVLRKVSNDSFYRCFEEIQDAIDGASRVRAHLTALQETHHDQG